MSCFSPPTLGIYHYFIIFLVSLPGRNSTTIEFSGYEQVVSDVAEAREVDAVLQIWKLDGQCKHGRGILSQRLCSMKWTVVPVPVMDTSRTLVVLVVHHHFM